MFLNPSINQFFLKSVKTRVCFNIILVICYGLNYFKLLENSVICYIPLFPSILISAFTGPFLYKMDTWLPCVLVALFLIFVMIFCCEACSKVTKSLTVSFYKYKN